MAVAIYRFAKRFGYYRHLLPLGVPLEGPFLSDSVAEAGGYSDLTYFSYHTIQVSSPPDWFMNPWNGIRCADSDGHWTEIPDFISELGDIKTVWEASRFDWLLRMAWAYRSGDESALIKLELWLRDWTKRNPVNCGINWKCGQEASFRCLNLLVAALAVDNCFNSPRDGFLQFLFSHLQRIVPTLRYAMAQDNNHGVSEAAALFVAGRYLCIHGNPEQQKYGRKWGELGRYWLENRVNTLIMGDGSFSQHSVVYHRLTLDVLVLTELLRRRLQERPFDQSIYERITYAVTWLRQVTDSQTGDAPNLGANDGSYLFNLGGYNYRDFRPSIQLASAVFCKRSVWGDEVYHPLLDLFDLDIQNFPPLAEPSSSLMIKGGYAFLKSERGFAMLRLPIYHFRPSHADALHLDLWDKGINWVRDAGTYSYNADAISQEYFPGTISHSTASFDNRDQMPRLARFLFGAWLKADEIEWCDKDCSVRSSYVDYLDARHVREIQCRQNSWCVIDHVTGFKNKAVIRWHLAPADWKLDNMVLSCGKMQLAVESDCTLTVALIELPESRYYLEQHLIPVLEISCFATATIKTTFTFF